jgi:uncharacterized protein YndB with AHSA1/START domain
VKNTGSLSVSLHGDNGIRMQREFDAPRQAVYDTFSKPELLTRWFGPRGFTLTTCEVDHRIGGGFRFVLRGPDGREMGMRGSYVELDPPARSVHRESFDDFPGSDSEVTLQLEERSGKTHMTVTVLYPSKEVRDAVLQSGMEHGAAESYDRLAELLGS